MRQTLCPVTTSEVFLERSAELGMLSRSRQSRDTADRPTTRGIYT